MPSPALTRAAPCPSAAAANEAIRAYAAGRTVWSPADLAELRRLWAVWREAELRESAIDIVTAA